MVCQCLIIYRNKFNGFNFGGTKSNAKLANFNSTPFSWLYVYTHLPSGAQAVITVVPCL